VIRSGFVWLGGAALVLAAMIASELSGSVTGLPVARLAIAPAPVRNTNLVGVPAASSDQRWMATILERPLFTPSRRPPAEAAQLTGALRLTGTIVGPDGPRAIFEPQEGGRAMVVREGERVGGALVRAIAPGKVVIVDGRGLRLLQPSFTSSAESLLGGPDSSVPAAAAERREAK
jgi:hypothetical protein